ncbi:hypothetical protein AL755_08565 [Arthrobacter sp. ERGS1:01]|uniref:hypothetical protein n=1 Tax=Arthrobacter sp. ERGS1:01 TaxID=1704044 RepID=UPI0006B61115|nr:hypothetical protein [Arthrobacter sp. ERGS1:01]ALE05520.1 hypothetical protein AL755_08565 [Arthrobacter sp. ERGS1:01]
MQTADYEHTQLKNRLTTHLNRIPELLKDLDITLTMQAKTGGVGNGGVSPKERNAFHIGASEVRSNYHSLLSRLCTIIDKDLGRFEYVTDTAKLATKAKAHAGWLATHEEANDWAQELDDLARARNRMVDRQAEGKVFAGTCPTDSQGQDCGTQLYTNPGNSTARCPNCKATWDARTWRRDALQAAGIHQGTATEISRAISDPVTMDVIAPATIRQWACRGKLAPIGQNHLGKPLYQIRKVRNLWARTKANTYAKAAT